MRIVIFLSIVIFAVLTFMINREKLTNKYKMVIVKNSGLLKYVNTTFKKLNKICKHYNSCGKYLHLDNGGELKRHNYTSVLMKKKKNVTVTE